jgi:quinol monooxygenase YgiN
MPTVPWRRIHRPEPDTEYLVMASRLPLRAALQVPRFVGLTVSVVRQVERTEGLVGYSLRAQPLSKVFWTLSAWTDEAALAAFARAMPHQAVMATLRPHMGPTRFATWTCTGDALPVPWDDAVERLLRPPASPPDGPVSPEHQRGRFAP